MKLEELLRQQFPKAKFNSDDPSLGVGSFPEWDSMGTFNFLMLVENTYGVTFSIDDMTEFKTLARIREKLKLMGVYA